MILRTIFPIQSCSCSCAAIKSIFGGLSRSFDRYLRDFAYGEILLRLSGCVVCCIWEIESAGLITGKMVNITEKIKEYVAHIAGLRLLSGGYVLLMLGSRFIGLKMRCAGRRVSIPIAYQGLDSPAMLTCAQRTRPQVRFDVSVDAILGPY